MTEHEDIKGRTGNRYAKLNNIDILHMKEHLKTDLPADQNKLQTSRITKTFDFSLLDSAKLQYKNKFSSQRRNTTSIHSVLNASSSSSPTPFPSYDRYFRDRLQVLKNNTPVSVHKSNQIRRPILPSISPTNKNRISPYTKYQKSSIKEFVQVELKAFEDRLPSIRLRHREIYELR